MTADGERWLLLNASPDLRQQIEQTKELQPGAGLRSSPIAAVVLTGGEVDNVAGLLTMRERQPFALYATAAVLAQLDDNPIFEVLARDVVARETLRLDETRPIEATGLTVLPFAVPGKVPLYLETATDSGGDADQTIGLAVSDARVTLFFIPGCAEMTPALAARLRGADAVLFDGTLWSDDELILCGLGTKTGRRMGHMSVAGPDGTLAAFAGLGVQRRVLLHINNSNPVLLDTSPERTQVDAAGWTVAHDGLELVL